MEKSPDSMDRFSNGSAENSTVVYPTLKHVCIQLCNTISNSTRCACPAHENTYDAWDIQAAGSLEPAGFIPDSRGMHRGVLPRLVAAWRIRKHVGTRYTCGSVHWCMYSSVQC